MTHSKKVCTGADRLLTDARDYLKNKKVGILTNHTGRLADGRNLIDVVADSELATLVALFGPEHGIAGDTPDGNAVGHSLRSGVPVYSLYGKTHKPTPEMLAGLDLLICDIQDVGARFYTFISTIALAMEAAAEARIPFLILDRPNPIRGLDFDGPIRESSLKSFVGWTPIPVTHGLTIGELARLWNNEGWLANGVRAELEIVAMSGWTRSTWYDETGLPWIPPSPNMPRISTAVIYPGLCLVEGTNVSEGRGTASPFELIGAPWMDPGKVIHHLKEFHTEGARFTPEEFTPEEIPAVAKGPKYEGSPCRGVRITIESRDILRPVRLGIALLAALQRAHPSQMVLEQRRFDILSGRRDVRQKLEGGLHPDEICAGWQDDLLRFGELREKYMIYPQAK